MYTVLGDFAFAILCASAYLLVPGQSANVAWHPWGSHSIDAIWYDGSLSGREILPENKSNIEMLASGSCQRMNSTFPFLHSIFACTSDFIAYCMYRYLGRCPWPRCITRNFGNSTSEDWQVDDQRRVHTRQRQSADLINALHKNGVKVIIIYYAKIEKSSSGPTSMVLTRVLLGRPAYPIIEIE
jgi:hypothetical protein